jgi:hypothetical protein
VAVSVGACAPWRWPHRMSSRCLHRRGPEGPLQPQSRHRRGRPLPLGGRGMAGDGGCAHGGRSIGVGQSNHPRGSRPGRLHGGRSCEHHQSLLVAAAWWAAVSARDRWRHRRVLHPVPAPERATALALARSAGGPGSAEGSGRRHWGGGAERKMLSEGARE